MIDNSALKFWFKNVLCLQELKKCFEKVIDPVCKEFHQKMMKELKTKGYTALRPMCCIKATIDYDRSEITCKAHNKTTSLDNLKGFCLDTKPDSNGEVVKLYCSCHNCDGILTHLRNSCYQNFDFEEVNLANSSLDQLFRSPYQLIKLYMNKGQGKSAISPSDIDISALISCVHNCSFVREKFTNILGDLNEVS